MVMDICILLSTSGKDYSLDPMKFKASLVQRTVFDGERGETIMDCNNREVGGIFKIARLLSTFCYLVLQE